MLEKTIEQIRDSRVWDMRDLGFDVSRVELLPIGDKWVMKMQVERPISIDEELHHKIQETIIGGVVASSSQTDLPATITTTDPENVGPAVDWDKNGKDPMKENAE